jgi:hypothetical protein
MSRIGGLSARELLLASLALLPVMALPASAEQLRDDGARFAVDLPAGWSDVPGDRLEKIKNGLGRLGGMQPNWAAAAWRGEAFGFDEAHAVLSVKAQATRPWEVDVLAADLARTLELRVAATEAVKLYTNVTVGDTTYDRERFTISFPWKGETRLTRKPVLGRVIMFFSRTHVCTLILVAHDAEIERGASDTFLASASFPESERLKRLPLAAIGLVCVGFTSICVGVVFMLWRRSRRPSRAMGA